MEEIEAIKTVSSALEDLQPDERARVLAWVQSKFGGAVPFVAQAPTPAAAASGGQEASSASAPKAIKAKTSKKAKTIISMDKSLDLSPQGKTSAVQFAGTKAPSNTKTKCVVAVYYLRDVIGQQKVTTQGVFTFFKTVQWPAPADLKNTLQQAGTEGWLDTADGDDIKITSLGENLVEHSLPPKAKG